MKRTIGLILCVICVFFVDQSSAQVALTGQIARKIAPMPPWGVVRVEVGQEPDWACTLSRLAGIRYAELNYLL